VRSPYSCLRPALILVILCAAAFAEQAVQVVTQDAATGKIFCRSQRFLIPYEAVDSGPAGVSGVRLYYTADAGATWTLYGERPGDKGSFEFTAPDDGAYGFTVLAVDAAGNVEGKDGPLTGVRPEIAVVVFPKQDMELAPGARMRIRFRADDANLAPPTATVSVRTSDSQVWERLNEVAAEQGEFAAVGPMLLAGRYFVKVAVADRAGNSSEEAFSFLATPDARPVAREEGPAGRDWEVPIAAPPRAKSLVFEIDYSVSDVAGQPPAQVGLWYTTDSGATWQFYGLDPDVVSPFRFQAPREAVYGFKLTAVTRSGVEEPRPLPGTKPDILTLVDVTYPTVMLDDPRGGESYAGGQVHYVKWTARDDNFGSLPITLYVARDGGGWELLASDLPNNSAYGWNVPLIEFATYRLKIEARDAVGNATAVVSDNFHIVSAPPETRIKAVVPAAPLLGVATTPGPPRTPLPSPSAAAAPTAPPANVNAEAAKKLVDKATALRLRGAYDDAEKALRDALNQDPRSAEARTDLGALLVSAGRHEEAVTVLQDARALAPADSDILYNLATAYYALGDYQESAAAFETLCALDPRNEQVLWVLGKAYYAAADVARARQTWQRIVDLDSPASPYIKRARQALASVPQPAVPPQK
jgi:cytochrome c-type biogenesis protein CcmH/NrfG/transposase